MWSDYWERFGSCWQISSYYTTCATELQQYLGPSYIRSSLHFIYLRYWSDSPYYLTLWSRSGSPKSTSCTHSCCSYWSCTCSPYSHTSCSSTATFQGMIFLIIVKVLRVNVAMLSHLVRYGIQNRCWSRKLLDILPSYRCLRGWNDCIAMGLR